MAGQGREGSPNSADTPGRLDPGDVRAAQQARRVEAGGEGGREEEEHQRGKDSKRGNEIGQIRRKWARRGNGGTGRDAVERGA